ncbi:metallophosphoesterase [Candidatus Nanohalococcus occultus]|uniref:metallophosphoesterase n=1 Tax=Candidatus Nanohalococcus occultus TaxID=2978047 RepID=UPI00325F9524
MVSTQFHHWSDAHGSADEQDIQSVNGHVVETGDAIYMGDHDNLYDRAKALDSEFEARSDSDAEWDFMPGNHDMTGKHGHVPTYDEVREQIDDDTSVYTELTGKEGEDPEDAESIFDVIIAQHDGVNDVRNSVVEKEDHVFYFGDTHQDPELPGEPGDKDGGFGYDFEEIAGELEEDDPTEDFGVWDYVDPRNWGTVYKSVTGGFNTDVDPESLDYRDVPDELITEEHKEYREEKQAIEEKLAEYDKPVILADHAVTRDEEWKYGSDINRDLAESGAVDMVLGGHDHGSGDKTVGDAKVINSALGASEVELQGGMYEDHSYEQIFEDPRERVQRQAQEQQEQQSQEEASLVEGLMEDKGYEQNEAEAYIEGYKFAQQQFQQQVQAQRAPSAPGTDTNQTAEAGA